jgi:hypothetical protein
MQPMRLFVETHDRKLKTFPDQLTPTDFEGVFALYEKACYAEGVVPLRLRVGYEDGRAFCLNMAPDAEAVKRAYDRVGLPFDSITEVVTATPGHTFFRRPAGA